MRSEIRHLESQDIDDSKYDKRFVGCVILTHDNKILLQQRPDHWRTYPGYQCEFGGHIENGETPVDAIVRELNEELGAIVNSKDLVSLGAISEAMTDHSEIIYVFFWRDKENSMTGCYEGSANYYKNVNDALKHPKMMESVRWLMCECQKKGLL